MTPIVAWLTLCPPPTQAEMPEIIDGLFSSDEHLGVVIAHTSQGRGVFVRSDAQDWCDRVGAPDFRPIAEVYDAGRDVLLMDNAEMIARCQRGPAWSERQHTTVLLVQRQAADHVLPLLGLPGQCALPPGSQLYQYVGVVHDKRWADICRDIVGVLGAASGRIHSSPTDAVVWLRQPVPTRVAASEPSGWGAS
jgi:hypothetical protein